MINAGILDGDMVTRLEYLGNEAILKETDTQYGIAKDTYANVVLERSFVPGKWNTFCIPFDMTAGQVAKTDWAN